MIHQIEDLISACERILTRVREKSKEEVNPILIRIQVVIQEFTTHLRSLSAPIKDKKLEKYHWSVLYRAGDMIDEMAVIIKNTTPVFIQTDVDYIKQRLIFFTKQVVSGFGNRESFYIITPKFQEMAGLW